MHLVDWCGGWLGSDILMLVPGSNHAILRRYIVEISYDLDVVVVSADLSVLLLLIVICVSSFIFLIFISITSFISNISSDPFS